LLQLLVEVAEVALLEIQAPPTLLRLPVGPVEQEDFGHILTIIMQVVVAEVRLMVVPGHHIQHLVGLVV
jgi:hypothetical protein